MVFVIQETGTVPTASQTHPILIVFDYIDQMPQFSNPTTSIMTLLRNPNTHIVIISKNYAPPDALLKEVDQQLMRGCRVIDVEPLSMIHTTQRMVRLQSAVYNLESVYGLQSAVCSLHSYVFVDDWCVL